MVEWTGYEYLLNLLRDPHVWTRLRTTAPRYCKSLHPRIKMWPPESYVTLCVSIFHRTIDRPPNKNPSKRLSSWFAHQPCSGVGGTAWLPVCQKEKTSEAKEALPISTPPCSLWAGWHPDNCSAQSPTNLGSSLSSGHLSACGSHWVSSALSPSASSTMKWRLHNLSEHKQRAWSGRQYLTK